MILLVGSHSDDALYCRSLLIDAREEPFFRGFPLTVGRIFSQEVMILTGVYTNALSSSLVATLLQKYYISLVVCLGRCYGLGGNIAPGSVVISRHVASMDTDMVDVANSVLHAVPGFPSFFKTGVDLSGYVAEGFRKRTLLSPVSCNIYSTDSLNALSLERAKENKGILGDSDPFVVDTISFGVALFCYLQEVPFIAVKAVERDIVGERAIEGYVEMLDRYVDIGKAVAYAIGDIGRNDVLRMRK